jgi:hypothetical protein
MLARFPRLARFATKTLEITAAAGASAFAALLLGNSREPPRPPATAVVQLAPADAQMIRYVREEGVALVEQLRSASEAHNAAPAAATAPAVKPVKAASPAPARKEQKASRPPTVEAKQRVDSPLAHSAAGTSDWEPAREPSPAWEPARVPPPAREPERVPPPAWAPTAAAAPTTAAAPASAASGDVTRTTAAAAAPAEASLPATPTAVPSRLWPAAASSLRDAPRPPLGVGEFLSSSM